MPEKIEKIERKKSITLYFCQFLFVPTALFFVLIFPSKVRAETLFTESFEDGNFSSRGWYDAATGDVVAGGQSGNCLRLAWAQGNIEPTNFGTTRRLFDATDSLYVSFYVKFQSTWRGSQQTYHPHIINILSDMDGDWDGPAWSNLDAYIEFLSDIGSPYNIRPQLAIQDSQKISTSGCGGSLPCDISSSMENRAVAGCNGTKTGSDAGSFSDCYDAGSEWRNGRSWRDSNTAIPKNQWVKVETYFKMNNISGNVGQADGVMKEWINGNLVIDHSNVIYRTNQDATKKFHQFVFGPWIGDGAPIAQTMWVDELTVGTGEPYTTGDTTAPACPVNLTVQ